MKKILLKNGLIVNSKKIDKKDVLIINNKIDKISKNIVEDNNTIVYDCKNKYVFPGFIDGHTHFDLSVSNTTTIDDFKNGTKAAISGGTTTIIDYATQYKNETLIEAYNNWLNKTKFGVSCDFSFHMSITDVNNKILNEIKTMFKLGITSFKLYTTYDIMLNDKNIIECMFEIGKNNGLVAIHCENDGMIQVLRNKITNNKLVINHKNTRPNICEAEAVKRVCYMAKLTNCPILIVHITCKEALEEIKYGQQFYNKIFTETCPQYLLFNEDIYKLPFNISSLYVLSPPLRNKSNNEYLWNNIINNNIDIISTDHCAFTKNQKKLGKYDYKKIPNGLNGVEHRNIIMFDAAYNNKISIEKMVELLAEKPSKLFGLDKKGYIKEGYDADIVIMDPNSFTQYNENNQITHSDYCIFNKKYNGKIEKVFLRGNLIVDSIKRKNKYYYSIIENKGKFIKRKKFKK